MPVTLKVGVQNDLAQSQLGAAGDVAVTTGQGADALGQCAAGCGHGNGVGEAIKAAVSADNVLAVFAPGHLFQRVLGADRNDQVPGGAAVVTGDDARVEGVVLGPELAGDGGDVAQG